MQKKTRRDQITSGTKQRHFLAWRNFDRAARLHHSGYIDAHLHGILHIVLNILYHLLQPFEGTILQQELQEDYKANKHQTCMVSSFDWQDNIANRHLVSGKIESMQDLSPKSDVCN